jgi:hypothetical protein
MEMKVFLRVGPMDESVYYALMGRGSPGDSLMGKLCETSNILAQGH